MALSLDDRLLGEKVENYCSSSEDEADDEDGKPPQPKPPKFIPESELSSTHSGPAVNTGPKGVIEDWRRFKQLETENRDAQMRERDSLLKKLSITCRSHLDDEKEKEKDEKFLEELEFDELEEAFLKEYREKRIEDMRQALENIPKFGKVIHISKDQFVEQIDKENPNVTVIVHLYEDKVKACQCMNGCIGSLAEEYPVIKFCKLKASDAKLSHAFSVSGVPAILIYKKGELIGNFVRICDDLGEDFYPSDLEGFLLEHGYLPEKTYIPRVIRSTKQNEDSSGSDTD